MLLIEYATPGSAMTLHSEVVALGHKANAAASVPAPAWMTFASGFPCWLDEPYIIGLPAWEGLDSAALPADAASGAIKLTLYVPAAALVGLTMVPTISPPLVGMPAPPSTQSPAIEASAWT